MKRRSRRIVAMLIVPTAAHEAWRKKSRRVWRWGKSLRSIPLFLNGEVRRRDHEMDNGSAAVTQMRGARRGVRRCLDVIAKDRLGRRRRLSRHEERVEAVDECV